MQRSQLAVWTTYYYDLTPEDAVLELKKNGITNSELSDEHAAVLLGRGDPKKVGAEFRAFLEKENFTMLQGHLWLSIRLCTFPNALEDLKKWIDLFAAIGIKNAVLHCDDLREDPDLTMEERLDRNIAQLKKIEAYVKASGVRICLENLTRICRNVEQLLYIVEKFDPDCFGICLDTGHLNLTKENTQREFILKAGDRLHALHIADNQGETDQHLMPYGVGHVKFAEVAEAIEEIGYADVFNYEIPGERRAPLPILGYKLEYIAKCYEYIMQEVAGKK